MYRPQTIEAWARQVQQRFLTNTALSLPLQLSSICRAAVHAGVVRNHGGYVDVMPVDKRKMYTASFQNGIFSER